MTDPHRKLTEQEIEAALADLDGWVLQEGKLHREFQFADFERAFAFMSGVALVAESAQHHPEWFNCYGRVSVWLTTHDVGGISGRDVELAATMDALATS